MTADPLLAKLTAATKGLLYPSESDAPLTPFVWEAGPNTAAAARRHAGLPAKARGKASSAADFFEGVADVDGFPALQAALGELLSDVTVYRFGAANVSLVVVGTAADGRRAGFTTTAVET